MDHPSFLWDYLFDKSLDWDSAPCFADPPYIACGEPDDFLTMDLELKNIPRWALAEEILLPQ